MLIRAIAVPKTNILIGIPLGNFLNLKTTITDRVAFLAIKSNCFVLVFADEIMRIAAEFYTEALQDQYFVRDPDPIPLGSKMLFFEIRSTPAGKTSSPIIAEKSDANYADAWHLFTELHQIGLELSSIPYPIESEKTLYRSEASIAFDSLARRCQIGCQDSKNELASYFHHEFYEIANRLCGGQNFARSLHATNLLNETFLRLLKSGVFADPKSRRFMFAAAGKTMRNVIADYFRTNRTKKRTPDGRRVYLDQLLDQLESQDFEFQDLNTALTELEELAPRQAEVVHMRFFFGMTMPEIAEKLQISLSTAEADWRRARAWLYKELT